MSVYNTTGGFRMKPMFNAHFLVENPSPLRNMQSFALPIVYKIEQPGLFFDVV